MIENCALYFPTEKLKLGAVIHGGRSDKGLLRRATWFEFDVGDGCVRLKLGYGDTTEHLRGFKRYVAQLPNSGAARSEAKKRIDRTRLVVGVSLPRAVAPDSPTILSLMTLLEHYDGFMFVADSMMLADGSFLVGPMAPAERLPEGLIDIPFVEVNPEDYRHLGPTEGVDPERIANRERIYCTLAERGYRCARWLPLNRDAEFGDSLRPAEEIAARALALGSLFLWVAATEDVAVSERLDRFNRRNALRDHLTAGELAILDLPRNEANQAHVGSIGWRLENLWALCWILGFDPPPPFFQGQLPQELTNKILFEFLPGLDGSLSDFVASTRLRDPKEVAYLEDIYYCTHNAVRSAQMGEDSVPEQFHPVRDGGAVHERRHALTWALSCSVAWDETDLST